MGFFFFKGKWRSIDVLVLISAGLYNHNHMSWARKKKKKNTHELAQLRRGFGASTRNWWGAFGRGKDQWHFLVLLLNLFMLPLEWPVSQSPPNHLIDQRVTRFPFPIKMKNANCKI